MYVESSTNGSWLNTDSRDQLTGAIKTLGSEAMVRDAYRQHGITDAAFNIMMKPGKTKQDFYDFINERESFFASQLEHYGLRRPIAVVTAEELDDDDR